MSDGSLGSVQAGGSNVLIIKLATCYSAERAGFGVKGALSVR